ncbi:ATP-binding protein [Mitsuaria sp. 7]|uniref:hybrid sensor histidine kinase/response regulator n=1 Tax=Mitsuaria sp. 7 TaxID=1658665 RepID=UPI0008357845|nr:ATP-binding protein [Mitsuaria sp. 7]
MSFDLTGFVQELMALRRPQDLLEHARRAAAAVTRQPAFASHLQPGRSWEQATVARGDSVDAASLVPIRSALHALHRRLSMTGGPLQIARGAETASIFHALFPDGPIHLAVVPLRNRAGRLTGALVVGGDGDGDGDVDVDVDVDAGVATTASDTLQTIATLAGSALETAWQQAAALRDQERMQLFSETTEESLWDWHVALDDLWWGGHVDRLFGGATRSGMRSDWRRTRVHPEDVERVTRAFDAALRGEASAWNAEYRLRDVDGQAVHVREHVYFLREADGRAHRAIGTVRDITALKVLLLRETAARADAERASGVKDEFLAMLGHELRNPLAPIVSVLTLLERRAGAPDRPLEILRRQTQHLIRLVDDLLDVSRISSGKVELSLLRTDIGPLVHRALEMVHPLIEQRRHRVVLELDEDLAVDVDAARMTQVLSNLLANAAKYTEPGGLLTVSAHAEAGVEGEATEAGKDGEGGDVVITVRDDGIGMSAEALVTVFDLFTQGRQALDRAQGGLGLGLSIVRNIVTLHGGTVEARSDGIGQGSSVVVRIPRSRSSSSEVRTGAEPEAARAVPASELLVIDDNEDAANLLGQLLVEQGHAVRIAHHPDEALRLFAEQAPQVAFIDIGLPTMDGYELARRLRAQTPGDGSKLVALTGYGLASDRTKALAAGFDEHVVKPVSPERLEALITQLTRAPD